MKDKQTKQPRLTVREVSFRDNVIRQSWTNYKAVLTMQEMANAFRMPLAQFYRIVKSKYDKEK